MIGTANLLVSTEHKTGVAAILVDKASGHNAISVIPGAAGTLSVEDVDGAAEEIKESAIFLTQLEAPIDTVIHALQLAKTNGVTTILNPAPAVTLDPEVFPLCDYFTPNETEASFYANKIIASETDAREAAQYFLDLGIKNIIITLGATGVFMANKDEALFVPSFNLGDKVTDTTGAGDAWNGAFATALCENKRWSSPMIFATYFIRFNDNFH